MQAEILLTCRKRLSKKIVIAQTPQIFSKAQQKCDEFELPLIFFKLVAFSSFSTNEIKRNGKKGAQQ